MRTPAILCLVFFSVHAFADAQQPPIRKLGTIDCDMVETTPIVFKDRLYRFEYVRTGYAANKTGDSYFRFYDVASGTLTPAFAKGFHLGCAWAEGDTMYVYGSSKWGGSHVDVFWSKDLATWETQTGLTLPPKWTLFNTSVCKGAQGYTMAFEVGEPAEVVGAAFTNFFALSSDLKKWELAPLECVYTKERYSACPSIRFLDGQYYMAYLEARPGPAWEQHIVRSRDLKTWESSKRNPILKHGPEDKRIANPALTKEQRERIEKALDRNNSDMDFCEYKGKVYITYSWGNQEGNEFLAAAECDTTLKQFLMGYFD